MEISLVQKDGVMWTRFKARAKEKKQWFLYLIAKYGIDVSSPVKQNSRFIYFEKKGGLVEWIENVAERVNGMKGNVEIMFAEISLQTNAEIIRHMSIAVMNMRNGNERVYTSEFI